MYFLETELLFHQHSNSSLRQGIYTDITLQIQDERKYSCIELTIPSGWQELEPNYTERLYI